MRKLEISVKILLADDHTLFRESLAVVLGDTFANSVVTSLGSWAEVLTHTHDNYYDLLLLDLFMPSIGSKCWKSSLAQVLDHPIGAVCIISASNNRTHIQSAFQAGVNGYICKTATLKQMKKALRIVASGKTYLPNRVWQGSPNAENNSITAKLTWRQREVLELLVEGDSNKLIARKLGLTESTVKTHVFNVYRALGAKNRVDMTKIARSHNISS